jgi:hypothetical protein
LLAACNAAPQAEPAGPAAPNQAQVPAPATAEPLPAASKATIRPVSPNLVAQVAAAGWKLDLVASQLPPAEGQYQPTGEEPNFIEYAYAGGALRLYVSPEGGQIFAILVDVSDPAWAGFADLSSSGDWIVTASGPYRVISRSAPVDVDAFATLRSRTWTLPELRALLGEPSYRQHIHGVGGPLYTYVPQGLSFFPADALGTFYLMDPRRPPWQDHSRPRPAFADYQRDFAAGLSGVANALTATLDQAKSAMADGKPSPRGEYRVALVHRGGYWGDWLYIGRPGLAEVRINPTYTVAGYAWLDQHEVVYVTGIPLREGFPVSVIDVVTGTQRVVAYLPCPEGMVWPKIGVIGPGRLWYEFEAAARRELFL